MPRTLSATKSDHGGLPPIEEDLYGGGGGDGDHRERGGDRTTSIIGLVVLMAASLMTFSAFISALVVRRGLSNDWTKFPVPDILWLNTAVLLASSMFLDAARRVLRRGRRVTFNWLWLTGTVLGAAFLAGQIRGWQQLNAAGIYISGHPSSSFFYILTWAHAAHAVGGLIALIYIAIKALRYQLGPSKRTAVDVSAYFWHFLDVLWLALMALFVFWG